MIVAPGAALGYKICKGKMNKGAIWIITIITILLVCTETLLIVPMYYEYKYSADLEYFYSQRQGAFIHDTVISLVFGLLGIFWASNVLNKNTDKEEKYDIENIDGVKNQSKVKKNTFKISEKQKEELEKVKKVFDNLNVYEKKDAVGKEKIIQGLVEEGIENPEKLFNKYKRHNIIKKYKDNYYFVSKNAVFLSKQYWIWLVIIVIIAVNVSNINNENYNNSVSNEIATEKTNSDIRKKYFINNTNLSFENPSDYIDYTPGEYKESSYGYYTKSNGMAEISFDVISKEIYNNNFDAFIQDREDNIKEFVKENYKVSDGVKSERTSIGTYENVYKMQFPFSFEGIKYEAFIYEIETENYYIEVFADSLKNNAKQNEEEFKNVIVTLKEGTEVNAY